MRYIDSNKWLLQCEENIPFYDIVGNIPNKYYILVKWALKQLKEEMLSKNG